MKSKMTLFILIIIFIGLQSLLNCSRPLDNIVAGKAPAGEVGGSSDSLVVVDTTFCDRLNCRQHEIIWPLQNNEGDFILRFHVLTDHREDGEDHEHGDDHENGEDNEHGEYQHALLFDIDGDDYRMDISGHADDFELETHLHENAIVRITSSSPHAYGHGVDICLRVMSD